MRCADFKKLKSASLQMMHYTITYTVCCYTFILKYNISLKCLLNKYRQGLNNTSYC